MSGKTLASRAIYENTIVRCGDQGRGMHPHERPGPVVTLFIGTALAWRHASREPGQGLLSLDTNIEHLAIGSQFTCRIPSLQPCSKSFFKASLPIEKNLQEMKSLRPIIAPRSYWYASMSTVKPGWRCHFNQTGLRQIYRSGEFVRHSQRVADEQTIHSPAKTRFL